MPWIALAAAGAAVIGGLVANGASSADREAALQAHKDAVQQWLNVNIPDPEQQKLALHQFMQTGTLNPAMQSAIKASPSAFNQIKADPQLKSAQMNALSRLQDEGLSGGLNLQDEATLQKEINDSNAAGRGRAGAIASQFAQRGQGGSGLELSAQLQNAQDETQNQGMNSLNAAAQSRQRALQAVMGAGQLGGQIQQQDYNEKNAAARANDAINMFNTQNLQNVNNQNTQTRNAADMYNLNAGQQISNANTELANKQQIYNKGLAQQNFNNQVTAASGKANAEIGQGNYLGQQASDTAGMIAGVGSGVGKAISAYGQYKSKQDQDEEDKNG